MLDKAEARRRVRIAVKGEMGRRGWNNQQLMEASGLDRSTVGDFLDGRRWPQSRTLGAIEKALGWPVSSIALMLEGGDPPVSEGGEGSAPVGAGVDPELLAELAQASPDAIEAVRAVLRAAKGG